MTVAICRSWLAVDKRIKITCAMKVQNVTFFSAPTMKNQWFQIYCWWWAHRDPCFSSRLLWHVARITCKNPIGCTLGTVPCWGCLCFLLLNCRVWRMHFSSSMNLPIIKARFWFHSFLVSADTYIVPMALLDSLNNNGEGIFKLRWAFLGLFQSQGSVSYYVVKKGEVNYSQ